MWRWFFRSFRPTGPLDQPAAIDGAALEGLVAQHLRAWIAYGSADHPLFYWRTRSDVDVDFVVGADYAACTPWLFYRGADRLEIDGVLCWPVAQCLAEHASTGWPITRA